MAVDMHLMRISLDGVPPFTEPIQLKFDEQVSVFIGPNASGKSTILAVLADRLNGPDQDAKKPIWQGQRHLWAGLYADDELDEIFSEGI